jgi:hypothetical protein
MENLPVRALRGLYTALTRLPVSLKSIPPIGRGRRRGDRAEEENKIGKSKTVRGIAIAGLDRQRRERCRGEYKSHVNHWYMLKCVQYAEV